MHIPEFRIWLIIFFTDSIYNNDASQIFFQILTNHFVPSRFKSSVSLFKRLLINFVFVFNQNSASQQLVNLADKDKTDGKEDEKPATDLENFG